MLFFPGANANGSMLIFACNSDVSQQLVGLSSQWVGFSAIHSFPSAKGCLNVVEVTLMGQCHGWKSG
jgi:hypothetical protein